LQAISNLAYFILANLGQNYPFMVLAINIENFCSGLGTAAFVAFLMSLCNARFTATQYALLSSLMAFSRDILVAPVRSFSRDDRLAVVLFNHGNCCFTRVSFIAFICSLARGRIELIDDLFLRFHSHNY
jgi:hypothetical protein